MLMKRFFLIALAVLFLPVSALAGGTVIEEIVARVNNDIITLSDYQKALAGLPEEVQQDCEGCAPDKINAMLADEKKNLLRSLIDKMLLVQRGKDLGIDVEADLVKELDQLRIQNGLSSMDALQKAVEAQGMNYQDYRQQMADSLMEHRVVQQEIGSNVKVDQEEILNYYNAHKSEFVKPEEVDLSEISFKTAGKTPAEAAAIEQKAANVLKRLQAGDSFSALAERNSDGATAAQGGEIGVYKRGELNPAIEQAVFALHKGDITNLIHIPGAIEIFLVNEHYTAGLQPLTVVENSIEDKLYGEQVQDQLRQYLDKLRRDSYVVVRAGYVDTGAVPGTNEIMQTLPGSEPTTPAKKSKKGK